MAACARASESCSLSEYITFSAVGGNHEASNYLWELYYGGWVAPNIYYLGHAGVVHFGGLRIGGLSGIFMQHNWSRVRWKGTAAGAVLG